MINRLMQIHRHLSDIYRAMGEDIAVTSETTGKPFSVQYMDLQRKKDELETEMAELLWKLAGLL
jgi:hypothetical protein